MTRQAERFSGEQLEAVDASELLLPLEDIEVQDPNTFTSMVNLLVKEADRDKDKPHVAIVISDQCEEDLVPSGGESLGKDFLKDVRGYTTRLLCACDENTIFVVPEDMKELTKALAAYFRSIGISTIRDENILSVADPEVKGLMPAAEEDLEREDSRLRAAINARLAAMDGRTTKDAVMIPFISNARSKHVEELLESYQWQDVDSCHNANHKGRFGEANPETVARTVNCEDRESLETAIDTEVATHPEGVDLFIKASRCASGSALARVWLTEGNKEVLKSILRGDKKRLSNVSLEHQGSLEGLFASETSEAISPILQRLLDAQTDEGHGLALQEAKEIEFLGGVNFIMGPSKKDIRIFDPSLQIMVGREHAGNKGSHPLWQRSEKLRTLFMKALYDLHDQGFRGFGGFDFGVVLAAGYTVADILTMPDPDPYILECNGRITGQTHANILACILNAKEWISENTLEYVEELGEAPVQKIMDFVRATIRSVSKELNLPEGQDSGFAVINLLLRGNKAMIFGALKEGEAAPDIDLDEHLTLIRERLQDPNHYNVWEAEYEEAA